MRRVGAEQWRQWRDVRLRARREAPEAFGSTYEQELELPPARWQERAAAGAAGDQRALFIAFDGSAAAGCAGGVREPGGIAAVISMWVAPEARRRGAAKALLDAVREWAAAAGDPLLRLHVVSTQLPARALYESYGFRYTGRSEAGRRDPAQVLLEMELGLTGP